MSKGTELSFLKEGRGRDVRIVLNSGDCDVEVPGLVIALSKD